MGNAKYLFIVRFPNWGENNEFPAFGVKYLLEIPAEIEHKAKEKEDVEIINSYFLEMYKEKIEDDFNGEILFVEECGIVSL